MAKKTPELPAELMEQIRTRLEARIGELKKYDIPQNSADHLLLVAVPIARDVITDVAFADDVIDTITPWLNSGEKRSDSRHTPTEELATRFGIDMVRHYRPEFSS